MQFDPLSKQVIGCALEVHRELGPGLLESAYEECLAYELKHAGLAFERQVEIPVRYKEIVLTCGYRADLIVDRQLILELKCVAAFEPIHSAQILTYMKLTRLRLGLLINFHVPLLKAGIKRFVL